MTGYVLTESSAGPTLDRVAPPSPGGQRLLGIAPWVVHSAGPPLLLAAAYYVGAQIGFALQSPRAPQSLLWLPNSILLAVLLIEPPRRWPSYLLAALPAQLLVALQTGAPLATMSLLFVTNCADAMLGATLVRRLTRGTVDFGSLRTMLGFVAFAATLSPIVLSFADAAITVLTGWGADYWGAFATRVRSNVLTHLVVVPALATALTTPAERWRRCPARRYAEGLAVLVALALTSTFAFDRLLDPAARPIYSIPATFILPFLLWLAVRLGSGMTAAGLLIVAFVASREVQDSAGAVATPSVEETIGALQFLLTGMAIPLLCLAAVIAERAAAFAALAGSYEKIGELAARVLVAQEAERTRTAKLEEGSRQLAHMGRIAATGHLAAALSHELRQPLSAIRSNAQAGVRFLESDAPPLSELKAILEDIVADDSRAASVIERIRTLLRNEQPTMGPTDLNRVCRDVEVLARADARLHETRLEFRLDPTSPAVLGDPVQLQQVVLNLVLNGIEAAAASETDRAVWVTTTRTGRVVELAVHDSGRGVAADVLPRVFEAFFSTKRQGLGMGLTIARAIVERHRGSIHAENEVPRGAVFVVTLPIQDAAPVAVLDAPAEEAPLSIAP